MGRVRTADSLDPKIALLVSVPRGGNGAGEWFEPKLRSGLFVFQSPEGAMGRVRELEASASS